MQYVYLDNYRGFQSTVIPVSGVNFCVGENSSGKTSFLNAIGLFASSRFWLEQKFDVVENGYRNFGDYVSVSSEDKSYFRMGFAEEFPDSESLESTEDRVSGYLFKYIDRKGVPTLASCTTNVGNHLITMYFDGGGIRYSHTKMKDRLTIDGFGSNTFSLWAGIQDDPGRQNIKAFDTPDWGGWVPPILIANFIAHKVVGKKGSINPIMRPPFGGNSAWIAPIRIKPRRTYDEPSNSYSPEGSHSPYLIKRLLDGEQSLNFAKFLSDIGADSGLFREIKVHEFGPEADSRFEMEVVLEDKSLNISNVGYGVSQALPIMAEAYAREEGAIFAIQQPEVHLHPRAQATIGSMIFELSKSQNKQFVVETHSDFTIDRYRVMQGKSGLPSDGQVLFFERKSGFNKVSRLEISDDGSMPEDQPEGYRGFFFKESLDVMRV